MYLKHPKEDDVLSNFDLLDHIVDVPDREEKKQVDLRYLK